MADVADIANEIEQDRITRILNNRKQNTNHKSAVECIECDEPIPEARRVAIPGVVTCVHCQTLNEDSVKWHQ